MDKQFQDTIRQEFLGDHYRIETLSSEYIQEVVQFLYDEVVSLNRRLEDVNENRKVLKHTINEAMATLDEKSGSLDNPRRMTLEEIFEVYQLLRKASLT
jgi:ArsR family metal-binding transcriptional regulator